MTKEGEMHVVNTRMNDKIQVVLASSNETCWMINLHQFKMKIAHFKLKKKIPKKNIFIKKENFY